MYVENPEENFTIFTTLWKDVAMPVVREIFLKRNQTLSPESRWSYVPDKASTFFSTTPYYIKNMDIEQKNKLKNENISEWDLPLLHTLLKNIDYSSGSEQIAADHAAENILVEKLKKIRNAYAHSSPGRIPHKKFIKLWPEAEKALRSLGVSPETIQSVKESGIIRSFPIFEPPSVNLVKRPEILQDLHTELCACSARDSLEERTVVLWGFDGIGKTELARMYVEAYLEDPIIQKNVAWINAEDLRSLEEIIVNLAKSLKLSTDKKTVCEISQNIFKHFSKHITAGICIFDNVYNGSQSFNISDYLPKPCLELNRYPLILITTRNCENFNPNYKFIQIKRFIQSELLKFLASKFQIDIDKEMNDGQFNYDKRAIKTLTEELQEYPLEIILSKIKLYLQRLNSFNESNLLENGPNSSIDETVGITYELVIANVWNAKVEKFRELGDASAGAMELLNFVAYLSTDEIKKVKLEELLKPFMDTASIQKSLDLLHEHSLMTFYHEYSERIQVDQRLQNVVRDRLNRENNFSYLLYICNYLCNQGLEGNSGGAPRLLLHGACSHSVVHKLSGEDLKIAHMGDMVGIHEYLKRRNWPNDTIVYSIIFCSLMADQDEAWTIAKDVYEFYDERESRTWNGIERSQEEGAVRLFLLSLFCMNAVPRHERLTIGHRMWNEPNLSKSNLEMIFLSLAKPSIEHKMIPKTNLTITQKHCYKLGFTSIQKLYRVMMQNFVPNVKKAAVQEISETVLLVVNSTVGCGLDSIHEIFELLWNCFGCTEHSNYIQYMEAAFQKHFEVFFTLNFDNETLNENETMRYWSSEIPIHFRKITDRHNSANKWAESSDAIIEVLSAKDGFQIIILQYLEFLGRSGVIIRNGDDLKLLYFIVSLLRSPKLNWAEKCVHTIEFMEAYFKFTTKLTETNYDNKNFILEKITCSMIWFRLFCEYFEHVPTESSEFTINSAIDQLTLLCFQLSQIKWNDDCKLLARQLKPLLEVFMEEWADYECIRNIAEQFDMLLEMHGIEFKNTSDIRHQWLFHRQAYLKRGEGNKEQVE